MVRPVIDINGGTFQYGGKAAETNRHLPAIQVNVPARVTDVHVVDAPFAAVRNGADLEADRCTNTTQGQVIVSDGGGDLMFRNFTSTRIAVGYTRRFAEGFERIFGKRS